MDRYEGAEFRLPPIEGILEPDFRIPFISYFLLFQIVGYCIRIYAWKSYSGFKQYRLRNLTLCVIHSSISGLWSFIFSITHQQVMLEETIHWYSLWAVQLPILSMAYFICDTMDMLRHEVSRWTIELLFHHTASVFAFASAVLSRKFIPYAYWALLMEINRFILFRFAVQIWQINWAWINRHHFHIFYLGIAFIGGGFFLIINAILFVRILASDGYLGEFGRQYTAIGRFYVAAK
ncbi:unnamed protein product [Acanthocheilonema viteae]|uniref:TLC domain-containing protein n=1 Tax=Acanthocheilonema viteae TaxID=6277 RepID=A0A498SN34_ACAVI|nr:unnamed protein product [Acanthocheilonema viteae]